VLDDGIGSGCSQLIGLAGLVGVPDARRSNRLRGLDDRELSPGSRQAAKNSSTSGVRVALSTALISAV
jgi:hypothetical protein